MARDCFPNLEDDIVINMYELLGDNMLENKEYEVSVFDAMIIATISKRKLRTKYPYGLPSKDKLDRYE